MKNKKQSKNKRQKTKAKKHEAEKHTKTMKLEHKNTKTQNKET